MQELEHDILLPALVQGAVGEPPQTAPRQRAGALGIPVLLPIHGHPRFGGGGGGGWQGSRDGWKLKERHLVVVPQDVE